MSNYVYLNDLDSEQINNWRHCQTPESDDIEIFKRACEYDKIHNNNQHHFDQCYENGFNDLSEETEAFEIFQNACEEDEDNLAAFCWLGRCYMGLWGTSEDMFYYRSDYNKDDVNELFDHVIDSLEEDEDPILYNYAQSFKFINEVCNLNREYWCMSRSHDLFETLEEGPEYMFNLSEPNIDYRIIDTDVKEDFETYIVGPFTGLVEDYEFYLNTGVLNYMGIYFFGMIYKFGITCDYASENYINYGQELINCVKVDTTYM